MSNLLELNHENNVFIARGKVKHTTGGPIMALVGFILPSALQEFQTTGEDLSRDQIRLIAEKIIIDKEKGIGFYPGVSSPAFYGAYWWDIPAKRPTGWYSENTHADKFLCLTRFYNESSKKFAYKTFSPLELELA